MVRNDFYYCFLFLFVVSVSVQAIPQRCHGSAQYDQCSINPACVCLHSAFSNDSSICAFRWVTCSELASCALNSHICYEPNHICIHHPDCNSNNQPLCYPLSMATDELCPHIVPTTTITTTPTSTFTSGLESDICLTAIWSTHGITVAGGKGFGSNFDQLADPYGIFLDDNDTIYIADRSNHRIVMWKQGATIGQWLAGVEWNITRTIALNMPQDLVVDKDGTMYISDGGNYRVVRWHRGAEVGEVIIDNVQAVGIALDDEGSIYVSEYADGRITKWKMDDSELVGQVIATKLRQSNFLFIDQDRSIYSVGYMTHRIVKVTEGVEEPTVVAGQSGNSGRGLDQLTFPTGVFVDQLGTVYVADTQNHRIMRWPKGATSGSLIIGEHGAGSASDELNYPSDLFLDRYGNLYVTDTLNNRVQKFVIDKSSCHNN